MYIDKYHTVWEIFSSFFLLNVFSLAFAIQIVAAYVTGASQPGASWQTINHLSSLIVERYRFMLTECTSFSRTTILPVQIYEYHSGEH